MSKGYNVAVVGATGAVGEEMLRILEERSFSVGNLRVIASERSEGRVLGFCGENLKVERLSSASFRGVEIALFSAGAQISREFSPQAVKEGSVVVDNSSAFRMESGVPLVVPEVNPDALKNHQGIIANPNCSTIQLVVAINPLRQITRIKRLIISTYQAVSGTGRKAMEELKGQIQQWLKGEEIKKEVYPHQIAFNLIPHIGQFLPNGYTEEELKLANETKKIMEDDRMAVTATCVRVPVFIGHSEAVTVEMEKELSVPQVKRILSRAPGVILQDNIDDHLYPLPLEAAEKDEVFVGRIRKDKSIKNGIHLWIVADNLRKGAALNAIQIAELLIKKNLL